MIIVDKITPIFKKIHPLEILLGTGVISAINYFYFPGDYLLMNLKFNPYLLIILFFSVFYGKVPGIFTLLISLACGVILFTVSNFPGLSDGILGIFPLLADTYSDEKNYRPLLQFIFISFILTIIFGEIRDSLGAIISKLKDQKDLLTKKITKLDQELSAISMVNEEYQDRILGQQSSLISLYSIMVNLNSFDIENIYPNIIDAVIKFSDATKCSLWKYHLDEKKLELVSSRGWETAEIDRKKTVPDSESILGWVARNNSMFTVKMLKKNQSLQMMDRKENIITVPITINNQVWGIINIESMPFVKYNLYSEQLISMISDLVAPIINNANRFNEITRMGEIDPVTKLKSINEMFIMLKEEFTQSQSRNLHLSFVVVEIINAQEIMKSFTEKETLTLVREISILATHVLKGRGLIFQYKDTFQLSIILPNMDYDGAAMFCLSIIEEHGKHQYEINNKLVNPEIIMGYSSLRQNHRSESDLLLLAENLLEMQKI